MLYSNYLTMPEILGTSKSIYGFDPRTIPGCVIWADASRLPSISGSWPNRSVDTTYTLSCTGTLSVGGKNGLNTVLLTTAQTWTTSPVVSHSAYTMFWSGRQTGGTNKRVLQGSANNQLFGYWNGYKKTIYTTGDPNQLATQGSDTVWDTFSHSRTASGPYTFNWNGSPLFSAATSTANALYGLSINTGESPTETSDCEVGEILLYNVVLTTNQIQQVEGYLAWKWGVQTNLPTTHPFYSRGIFTRYFNPIDIPDCALWLDAMDKTTITFGTSPAVASWRDKSIGGHNYSQATTAWQPTHANNGISFGYGNVLTNTDIWSANGASVDIFVVSTPWPTTQFNSGGYWRTLFRGATNGHYVILESGSNRLGNYENVTYGFQQFGSLTLSNVQNILYVTTNSSLIPSAAINGTVAASAAGIESSDVQPFYALGGYMQPTAGSPSQPWGVINEVLIYSKNLRFDHRQQIEGYLAQKWNIGTSFLSTHPFYKIPPLSPLPFSPLSLPSCILWLDAADPSTLFSDSAGTVAASVSGTVGFWKDKSAAATSVSNATSGQRPTYTINGLSYAGGQILTGTPTTLSSTGLSAFVVFNPTTPATRTSIVRMWSNYYLTSIETTYNDYMIPGLYKYQAVSPTAGVNNIMSLVGYTPSLIEWAVNVATSSTTWTFTGGPSAGTELGIGSRSGLSLAFTGTISEVIIYDAFLSVVQKQKIEGYLAWKWGIALPSTHLFYKFTPSQRLAPVPVASVTTSLSSTTLTASWPASVDATSYTVALYSSSTSGGTYAFVSSVSVTALTTNFTLSVVNYYKVYVTVIGLDNASTTAISSFVNYTGGSSTWSFTTAYTATSNPTLAINGSLVSTGATSFADTRTGGTWYFNTHGYGGYTNPTVTTITIDSTHQAIKLPGSPYGFLSYGTWDQSTLAYPRANTSTGFAAVHTVIIIYWKYGANIGSGGEGSGNSVTSGSIIYSLGRSSAYNYPTSGSGTYTGEIITGETGVWTYGFGPNGSTGYGSQISNTGSGISSSTATGWVCEAFTFQRSSTCAYYRATGSSSPYTVTTPATMTGSGQYVDGSLYVGVDQRNTYYGGDYGNLLNGGIAFFGMWTSYFTSSQFQAFINAAGPQFGTFI